MKKEELKKAISNKLSELEIRGNKEISNALPFQKSMTEYILMKGAYTYLPEDVSESDTEFLLNLIEMLTEKRKVRKGENISKTLGCVLKVTLMTLVRACEVNGKSFKENFTEFALKVFNVKECEDICILVAYSRKFWECIFFEDELSFKGYKKNMQAQYSKLDEKIYPYLGDVFFGLIRCSEIEKENGELYNVASKGCIKLIAKLWNYINEKINNSYVEEDIKNELDTFFNYHKSTDFMFAESTFAIVDDCELFKNQYFQTMSNEMYSLFDFSLEESEYIHSIYQCCKYILSEDTDLEDMRKGVAEYVLDCVKKMSEEAKKGTFFFLPDLNSLLYTIYIFASRMYIWGKRCFDGKVSKEKTKEIIINFLRDDRMIKAFHCINGNFDINAQMYYMWLLYLDRGDMIHSKITVSEEGEVSPDRANIRLVTLGAILMLKALGECSRYLNDGMIDFLINEYYEKSSIDAVVGLVESAKNKKALISFLNSLEGDSNKMQKIAEVCGHLECGNL